MIREDFYETYWLQGIRAVTASSLRSAATQKVGIVRTLFIHVRVGDARIRVVFGVARSLGVPILLRISFIDRFVKGILPPEQKVVLYNSALVLIIVMVTKTEDKQILVKNKSKIVKNATVAEEVHNPHRLYVWQGKLRYRQSRKM